jgi:hypothetical protein
MKTDKEVLYESGVELLERFCALNNVPLPTVLRLSSADRLYHLATCAFYRPTCIRIMVEKCASRGYGGRAWSWPGYAIDRTPYGVLQHELGHHVDNHRFQGGRVFSRDIYEQSKEAPLTGYLGTDSGELTFYMEWFAENFRLFVTNPDFSKALRPKFFAAMVAAGFKPLCTDGWKVVLVRFDATERILLQAQKKIEAVDVSETPELINAPQGAVADC